MVGPRQRSRFARNQRLEPGPRFAQVMELASEIGLCLNVSGLWPERPAHTLTRDGTRAPVEHEKGDELLLPRTRKARDRSAVDADIEPAKQIDPERGCACHISKITRD
jgi:hypothetical protein